VVGIVSVHELAGPRHWSEEEIGACRTAAERLVEIL
jgi:hypothetical protein